ncbi:MAG: ankyrin repeat domain-containing protein, partial [Phycisphaeraceae bacterium]|nr:ankyrin repeat domain-containing protein [Phycisphaeraceae bacterium]
MDSSRESTEHLNERLLHASEQGDLNAIQSLIAAGASPNGEWVPKAWRPESVQERVDTIFNAGKLAPPKPNTDLAEAFADAFSRVPHVRKAMEEAKAGPWGFLIPLFRAASKGQTAAVLLLLELGADINARDQDGATALFEARSPETILVLLRAGIDPTVVKAFDSDALDGMLFDVADSDCSAFCEPAADAAVEGGVPLLRDDARGRSRLHRAAWFRSIPAITWLLRRGHPVQSSADGVTPLHQACWHDDYDEPEEDHNRHTQLIDLLVSAGIDVNARDESGCTALHEAAAGDGVYRSAIKALIRHGADVNAQDNDGRTPLHLLYDSVFDYEKAVPHLLKAGADPTLRDRWGRSVLDCAEACFAGNNPHWREEQWRDRGGPPCGWKDPGEVGD